jgi:hypothetical protein
MAETKILNLDEMLATTPERVVVWQGQNHPVVGMTGEAYLKFMRARVALDKAQKSGDEAMQFEQNLAIIGIVAPTLDPHRADLLKLNMTALTALVQFIMADTAEIVPGGAGGNAEGNTPGESTSPA